MDTNTNVFQRPPTRIRELVIASGKTLREISEETGVPYGALSSYNQGTRHPKKENAEKLAGYFKVTVAYLMGIDDNPKAPSNLQIITDSFKTAEINSVTPFKRDMETLQKSLKLGEIRLSMPLNDTFSDEFRKLFSQYLNDHEEDFLKTFIKHMNNQTRDSEIWKSWIQTKEYHIRQTDRQKK